MHTSPITVFGCLLLTTLVGAAELMPIPVGGRDLVGADALDHVVCRSGGEPALGRGSVVRVSDGPGFNRAVRYVTEQSPAETYKLGFTLPLEGGLAAGDVVLLSFWARGLEAEDESGRARLRFCVELAEAPHSKSVVWGGWIDREWQRIDQPAVIKQVLPDGKAQISVHLGYYPQTVEIGGMRVIDYGPDQDITALPRLAVTYPGREADAPWRAAALERIEQLRTAPLTVRVEDAQGAPAAGATVSMAMTRHAFGFGSAVTAGNLSMGGPDNERYRAIVAEHFNKVVLENDLKWRWWLRGAENAGVATDFYDREKLDHALTWLAERDIEVRGHRLVNGPLKRRSDEYRGRPEALMADTRAHVIEKATWVGDRVSEWDAINHIIGWADTYHSICGGYDVYVELMQLAREVTPAGTELWLNEGRIIPDGGRRDAYEAVTRYLQERGAGPDGLGFMGHFSMTSLTPPEEMLAQFDRFAALVPKLQYTELDVGTFGDEQLQADYYRDCLIAAYSHPAMEAVILWGFWEGRHWLPERALWRQDWSIKPCGQAWLDLVKGDWWTEAEGLSDAAGQVTLRGHHGSYAVAVTTPDGRRVEAEAQLIAGGSELRVVLPEE